MAERANIAVMQVLTRSYILVSSYLSHLQLLPISSPTTPITLPLPNLLGATCGTYLNYPSSSSLPTSSSDGVRLAAGGVDSKVHIFDIPSLSDLTNQAPREVYTLHGHTAPITSIITGREGQDVVSASWDGHINLYVLPPGGVGAVDDEHYVEAEPTSYLPGQKKRRRLNKEKGEDGSAQVEGLTDGEIGQAGWRRNPDNTLTGHKGRIGGMVWDKNSKDTVWSAGWDGSVRGWDLGGVESTVKVSLYLFVGSAQDYTQHGSARGTSRPYSASGSRMIMNPFTDRNSKDRWTARCSASTNSALPARSLPAPWTVPSVSGILEKVHPPPPFPSFPSPTHFTPLTVHP